MKPVRPLAAATSVALASATALALVVLAACSPAPERAPDVAYTLLDGHRSALSSLRGQVVLVNFWATDCAPCIEEMPALVANWRKYAADGFQTLAVSMDYDAPALVSQFAQAHRLPFAVVIDNTGAVGHSFGDIRVTPTSVLIDRQGRIVRRWSGRTDFKALGDEIATLQRER